MSNWGIESDIPASSHTNKWQSQTQHTRRVEGAQGVNVHHGLEGVEGQCAGRAQEVSGRTCGVQGDSGWCWSSRQLGHRDPQDGPG